jgi:hypothetical protein
MGEGVAETLQNSLQGSAGTRGQAEELCIGGGIAHEPVPHPIMQANKQRGVDFKVAFSMVLSVHPAFWSFLKLLAGGRGCSSRISPEALMTDA